MVGHIFHNERVLRDPLQITMSKNTLTNVSLSILRSTFYNMVMAYIQYKTPESIEAAQKKLQKMLKMWLHLDVISEHRQALP